METHTTPNQNPPQALSSASRRDLILSIIKYQFCESWRKDGQLICYLDGSTLEARDIGGSAGKRRLRELRQFGYIEYIWKWNDDRTDTKYMIKPGPNWNWDWTEKPHPERRAVTIPDDIKYHFSDQGRSQLSFFNS